MELGLAGRTAVVCGASSGLGLASAEALAGEGAHVAMLARRGDRLEREAARIGAVAVPGDVTEAADLERLVATAVERFGGLDVVVWNGGGPPPGPALELDEEALAAAYELVLLPAVRLTRLALPHLERSPAGRLIFLTSVTVKEPTPHLALSNVLRPGVAGYAKSLARELGPKGITVNCVAPGRIDTARLEQLYPGGPTPEQLADIPLRRFGRPEEFAAVVCFLASDRASYVTGATIPVDGGLTRALL